MMKSAECFARGARGMATSTKNNLIFLGAPGVGKGTFASRVSKKLGIPAISTGDIIRLILNLKDKVSAIG